MGGGEDVGATACGMKAYHWLTGCRRPCSSMGI